MGNINIRNVSIRSIKCKGQGQTAKVLGEGFNVAFRSKLCYNILIDVIIISNRYSSLLTEIAKFYFSEV